LHVDAERWRAHAVEVRDKVCAAACGAGSATSEPWDGLVPVAKGNGYGLGNARLAREAARLGVTTLAVGTASEVAQVADRFGGDVLVLNPYQPADASTAGDWAALGHHPVRGPGPAHGLLPCLPAHPPPMPGRRRPRYGSWWRA
jgi:hypothetical protein